MVFLFFLPMSTETGFLLAIPKYDLRLTSIKVLYGMYHLHFNNAEGWRAIGQRGVLYPVNRSF